MQYLRSRSCAPGELIVRKGDEAHSMYLIASGDVEVLLPGESVRLGPGDFFGEMAILKSRRRAVTVRAMTHCRLLVLDAEDFHELLEANPTMAQHVHETVEARGAERGL
jgi:voltage-gated potassium channel